MSFLLPDLYVFEEQCHCELSDFLRLTFNSLASHMYLSPLQWLHAALISIPGLYGANPLGRISLHSFQPSTSYRLLDFFPMLPP